MAEKAGHIVDGAGSNSHTQVAVCGHVDEELTDGGLVKADVGEDLRLRMAPGCGEHLCAALSGDLIGNKVADQVGVLKAQFFYIGGQILNGIFPDAPGLQGGVVLPPAPTGERPIKVIGQFPCFLWHLHIGASILSKFLQQKLRGTAWRHHHLMAFST